MLILGTPPTESGRLDAWQDPADNEQQQKGHPFPPSPDPDVVPAPPIPGSQLPPHPVSLPVSFAPRVHAGNHRLRDSTGRFTPTIRCTSQHAR